MEPTINEIRSRLDHVVECTEKLGAQPGKQMVKLYQLFWDRINWAGNEKHRKVRRRELNKQIRELAKESGLIE
jgi:hypothetical protein